MQRWSAAQITGSSDVDFAAHLECGIDTIGTKGALGGRCAYVL